MWIATPLQENKGLLRNNVRRCASWILVFLDILKIIGNSWDKKKKKKKKLTREGLYPWDQHGFAFTTSCPFREVLAGPLVYCRTCELHAWEQKATFGLLILFFSKQRSSAPLDWISNTMNFIDSLTLLFLTLSAVKVSVPGQQTDP